MNFEGKIMANVPTLPPLGAGSDRGHSRLWEGFSKEKTGANSIPKQKNMAKAKTKENPKRGHQNKH